MVVLDKVIGKVAMQYAKDNVHSCDVLQTLLYCPHCGVQGILQENGSGDYYVGENFFCKACQGVFTFQGVSHSRKLTFQL